ncbi:MAG TPA: phage tail length tape measure family protein [Rhizomicrobium sp.]
MAVRIAMDGKADIQRDLDDIAQSGDAAFAQVGKAIDQGTAAIQRQHAAFDQLTEAQKNAQVAQANQSSFNQLLGVNDNQAGSARDAASTFQAAFSGMEQRAAALRAQIDPLGTVQGKMNDALADANMLLASGTINQTEHAAAVALARKAYDDARKSIVDLSSGEELNATKARELTEVFVHLGEGATAGGLSLRQLGMAAGDLLRASSGEGIGAAIGAIVTNPAVDSIAAIVAGGAAIVLAYNRAEDAENQLTQATELSARGVGATKDQIEAYAEAAAAADNISVRTARDMAAGFAKTGQIGGQQLQGLIDLTVDYARKTGTSMDDAQAEMIKAFTAPQTAGEALLKQLGGLDDNTAQLIERMMQAGDETGAQTVLTTALIKALKDATDQTTWYGNAWQWVKNQYNGVVEAMSKPFKPPSLKDTQAQLQQELALAQQGIGLPTYDPEKRLGGSATTAPARSIADIEADLARVNAAIDATNAKAKQSASDAAAQALSLRAGPLVRGASEESQSDSALASLKANQAQVDALGASQAAMAKSGVTTQQVTEAQDAYTRAIQTYIDPATKQHELEQLAAQAISAKTVAQKVAIAEQQKSVELAGKVVTTAEAQREIDDAGAKARAQATASVKQQTTAVKQNVDAWIDVAAAYLKGSAAGAMAEDSGKKLEESLGHTAITGAKQAAQLADETAARKALNDQVAAGSITSEQSAQAMATENALAPLRIAYDIAEGKAKQELGAILDALTRARANDNAEATRTKALALVQTGNQNIDLLKKELAIANDNDSAREVEIAVLQAKQQLIKDNISADSEEGRQILANAAASTQLNQQLKLAQESRQELEGMFDTLATDASNFLTNGKFSWNDWKQLGLSASKEIETELVKLAAIDPLKNDIFGTNTPTLESVFSAAGGLGKPDGTPTNPIYVVMSPLSSGFNLSGGSSSGGGGLLGWFTSLFGGSSLNSDAAVSIAGVFHAGSMVSPGSGDKRALPSNVLRFAPRFHDGVYLGPDEVPSILQTGERVLNRTETKAYNRGHAGGVTIMPGAIVIQTPNPGAFHASSGQTMAKLAGAVRNGSRRY